MNPRRVILALDLRQELIPPFAIRASGSVAHAHCVAHHHQMCFRVQSLQLRNGTNESVATAVGLQRAVHERDDRLTCFQHRAIRKREGCR